MLLRFSSSGMDIILDALTKVKNAWTCLSSQNATTTCPTTPQTPPSSASQSRILSIGISLRRLHIRLNLLLLYITATIASLLYVAHISQRRSWDVCWCGSFQNRRRFVCVSVGHRALHLSWRSDPPVRVHARIGKILPCHTPAGSTALVDGSLWWRGCRWCPNVGPAYGHRLARIDTLRSSN